MQSAIANVDVLIRGSGAVGSSLALALSAQGLSALALLGREQAPRGPDVRTYALCRRRRDAAARAARLGRFGRPDHRAHYGHVGGGRRRGAGLVSRPGSMRGVSGWPSSSMPARWTNNWPPPCALRRE